MPEFARNRFIASTPNLYLIHSWLSTARPARALLEGLVAWPGDTDASWLQVRTEHKPTGITLIDRGMVGSLHATGIYVVEGPPGEQPIVRRGLYLYQRHEALPSDPAESFQRMVDTMPWYNCNTKLRDETFTNFAYLAHTVAFRYPEQPPQ